MHSRTPRHVAPRAPIVPIHRGPQAVNHQQQYTPSHQAPNAAFLIDFDNVTMGIRSDLASELRSLLSSDIIKGKVAVQRAYADWRRYPQYVVPLAESSIDMIMAPAYGSSKKNATDIRLAVDAIELVFTRPEIGTYILLSGDSDFASMVTKLKEYGKYVIGVGIRESSSDLLVMNCDEYYSYNALAGLVKAGDEEVQKWDAWELVVEAIGRMQKNGDVMRSDRLKQVMQDIDATFDEKNVGSGYSKFSRFVGDAADKGLLKVTKLDNGQLEVTPADGTARPVARSPQTPRADAQPQSAIEQDRGAGARRGRRGRGRGRGGADATAAEEAPKDARPPVKGVLSGAAAAVRTHTAPVRGQNTIGLSGERLTRQDAFDVVRRATAALAGPDDSVLSSDVRKKAYELLGRDSESLGERYFHRILRDAHDVEVIDLRRRGDDYEVSLPASAAPVAEQLKQAEAAIVSPPNQPATAAQPRGMGPRGIPQRGRGSKAPPPELLLVGVVEARPSPVTGNGESPVTEPAAPGKVRGRTRVSTRAKKVKAAVAGQTTTPAAESPPAADKPAAAGKPRARSRSAKTAS
ncbi:MAG: NYN domain-containing protein [Gemmatimonadota bacterium]